MNTEEYLQSRVNDQIDWYDSKSRHAQLWFKRTRRVEILSAISIPLIAGFGTEPIPVPLVVGLLGGWIAVLSIFVSLEQFQENWIEYRFTCQSLQHEKYLFLTGSAPYSESDAFNLFVQQIESILAKENCKWTENVKIALDNTHSNSKVQHS